MVLLDQLDDRRKSHLEFELVGSEMVRQFARSLVRVAILFRLDSISKKVPHE